MEGYIDDGTGGLTGKIIGAAITVHRYLGPGLLERSCESCLHAELRHIGLDVERQVALPLVYRDVRLDHAYRVDLWVERRVVVEVKSVARITAVDIAQVQTYVRFSESQAGLLFNFNVPVLAHGGFRRILPGRERRERREA